MKVCVCVCAYKYVCANVFARRWPIAWFYNFIYASQTQAAYQLYVFELLP